MIWYCSSGKTNMGEDCNNVDAVDTLGDIKEGNVFTWVDIKD